VKVCGIYSVMKALRVQSIPSPIEVLSPTELISVRDCNFSRLPSGVASIRMTRHELLLTLALAFATLRDQMKARLGINLPQRSKLASSIRDANPP